MFSLKKVFVDWAVKKPHKVYVNNEITDMDSTKLISLNPSEVYLESGCPNRLLFKLLEKGHKVFVVDGKLVKKARKHGIIELEKSDIVDVELIKKLAESSHNFRELEQKEKKQIELKYWMSVYNQLTKDSVRIQHIIKSFQREFLTEPPPLYQTLLSSLEKQKKEILDKTVPLVEDETLLFSHIKGVGKRYIAGLLAVADPRNFKTLSMYLLYCGHKEDSFKKTHKYSRQAKSLVWQMVKQLIMAKDENYYKAYLMFKKYLAEKHPDFSKGKINGMAMNRVGSFLLKEFFDVLKGFSLNEKNMELFIDGKWMKLNNYRYKHTRLVDGVVKVVE